MFAPGIAVMKKWC